MSIAAIKAAISLPELIGEYVKLRALGAEHIGLCPFHQENTPSFRVHSGFAKCFGCGWAGDSIAFLAKIEGWTIGRAIRELSSRTGIPLDGKPISRRQRAYDAQEMEFARWWQKRKVEQMEATLTCYVRFADMRAIELGPILRALKASRGIELRMLATRCATAQDRQEWGAQREDSESFAKLLVNIIAAAPDSAFKI